MTSAPRAETENLPAALSESAVQAYCSLHMYAEIQESANVLGANQSQCECRRQ